MRAFQERRLMSTRFRCSLWMMALLALPISAHGAGREAALIDAVKSGNVAAVRTLVRQGNVNATESNGTTALHWAVQLDHAPLVNLLIESGAKVRVANRYGMTPLALAAL